MVLLKPDSSIDPNKYPFTHEWDTLRRLNHNMYEEEINRCLFQLQKLNAMYLPYRIFHPQYRQHNYLELQIYENLQSIGKHTEEELTEYKRNHPSIEADLNQVFSYRFPVEGFAVGLALQAIPVKFKLSLSMNVLSLLAPMFLQWSYRKSDIGYKHRVNQFLDWTLERRKGKAMLERNKEEINAEAVSEFNRNYPNGSALKVFKQYMALK